MLIDNETGFLVLDRDTIRGTGLGEVLASIVQDTMIGVLGYEIHNKKGDGK